MSFLSNKHLVIAMIVAPVLAIISYFGIGYLFGEKPQVARQGESYPMVEKPNCRYRSGRCGLKNADFELEMTVTARDGEEVQLTLESAFPLDGVMLAVARAGGAEPRPGAMRQGDPDGRVWIIQVETPDPETDRLQLVASLNHSYWFGETSASFTEPAQPD